MRFEPNKVPRVEYAVWQILIHWGWDWDYQRGRIKYARQGSDVFVEAWEAIEDELCAERELDPPIDFSYARPMPRLAAGASPKPPGPDQTSAAGQEAEPPSAWQWEREGLEQLIAQAEALFGEDARPSGHKAAKAHAEGVPVCPKRHAEPTKHTRGAA